MITKHTTTTLTSGEPDALRTEVQDAPLLKYSGDVVGYSLDINSNAVPRNPNTPKDIYNNALAYNNRINFDLKPHQQPAWFNDGADYAELSHDITITTGVTYVIETLILNYSNSTKGTIIGVNGSSNYIFGLDSDNVVIKLGSTEYNTSTGLDLSTIINTVNEHAFICRFEWVINNINDINYIITIKDTDGGSVLFSTSANTVNGDSGFIVNQLFANFNGSSTNNLLATVPWVKLYTNGELSNYWVYTSAGSAYLWDVVGLNHGLIQSADFTVNYALQDLYSYPLEHGYNKAWSFDGSTQYQQLTTPIHLLADDGDYLEMRVAGLDDTISGSQSMNNVFKNSGATTYIYLRNNPLDTRFYVNNKRYNLGNINGLVSNVRLIKLIRYNKDTLRTRIYDKQGVLVHSSTTSNDYVTINFDNNQFIVDQFFKYAKGILYEVNISGTVYNIDNPFDYSLNTATTELIPAKYGESVDVFDKPLKYADPVLMPDVAVKAPDFRIQEYLDITGTNSNIDPHRYVPKSDSTSHLQLRLENGHDLRDFVTFKSDTDIHPYFRLENDIILNAGNSYKVEVLYNSYTDSVYGTLLGNYSNQSGFGGFNYNSYYMRFDDVNHYVETNLDLSELTDFKYIVSFNLVSNDVINITHEIYKGDKLLDSSAGHEILNQALYPINTLFACAVNGTYRKLKARVPYIKLYVNDILSNYWVYTEDDNSIMYDKVNGNNAILYTVDPEVHVGVQNVYKAVEEGSTLYLKVNDEQTSGITSNYIPYLWQVEPIEVDGKTLILDEGALYQPNRPTLYNRCLLGDGSSTINLSSGIVGTLTLKGWTKEGGVWAYRDITTGLSGTTLTLQSSVYYKSIERYDDGVKRDTAVCEEGAGLILYTNIGDELPVTTGEINLVRVTQDDAPLLELSGDVVGFSKARTFSTDIENATINNDSFSFVRYYTTNTPNSNIGIPKQVGYFSPDGDASASIGQDEQGKFYVISYNDSTSRAVDFNNVTNYDAVRLNFEIVQGTSCTVLYRDFSKYNAFTSWLAISYSVPNIDTLMTSGDVFYKFVSGTDATHGDNYPDAVLGITGLTSTLVRNKLDEIGVVNVTAWVDAVDTAVNVQGKNPKWIGILRYQITVTYLSSAGVFNQEIDLSELRIYTDYDGNGLNQTSYYNDNITLLESLSNFVMILRVAATGDVHYTKLREISFINYTKTVPAHINNPTLDVVYNAPLDYSGRKDQPLQVGGVAVSLDTTRNKEIQCSQSLTGVTVTALYGEEATTGNRLTTSMIGVDTVNNKLYNNNSSGYDIKLARVDLSDGTRLKVNDSSGVLLDSSSNKNHAYMVYDIFDFITTQKYYNDIVLYGCNSEGWTNDVKPPTHGSTVIPSSPDQSSITKNAEYSFSITAGAGSETQESFWIRSVHVAPWKVAGYNDIRIRFRVRNTGSRNMWVGMYGGGSNPLKSNDPSLTYDSVPYTERFYLPTTQTTWLEVTADSLFQFPQNDYPDYIEFFFRTDDGLPLDNNVGIDVEILELNVYYGGSRVDLQLNAPQDDNNEGNDVFGNTLDTPSGIHLNNTQKQYVQLPTFKTLEQAYQSNEEYWRDKLDTQGNAVLDRHLVPLSLEHSDKSFPAFKTHGAGDYSSGGYFNITPITLSGVAELEVMWLNYTPQAYIQTILGGSTSDNVYFLSISSTGLLGGVNGWSSTAPILPSNFIFKYVINYNNSTREVYVYDLQRNLLFSEVGITPLQGYTGVDSIFTTLQGTTSARRNPRGTFPYVKITINGTLTNYWTYTGNNSLLLQDRVGGKHGTLITADVSLNQGVQDVYNPFEDGVNIEGWTTNLRDTTKNIWADLNSPDEVAISAITNGVTITGLGTGDNGDLREVSNASLLSNFKTEFFPNSSAIRYRIEADIQRVGTSADTWLQIDVCDTVGKVSQVTQPDLTWTPTYEDDNITANGFFKIDSQFDTKRTVLLDTVKHTNSGKLTNGNFIDIFWKRVDGGNLLNIDSVTIDNIKVYVYFENKEIIPKHPYNGLDVFGNELTSTPLLIPSSASTNEYTNFINTNEILMDLSSSGITESNGFTVTSGQTDFLGGELGYLLTENGTNPDPRFYIEQSGATLLIDSVRKFSISMRTTSGTTVVPLGINGKFGLAEVGTGWTRYTVYAKISGVDYTKAVIGGFKRVQQSSGLELQISHATITEATEEQLLNALSAISYNRTNIFGEELVNRYRTYGVDDYVRNKLWEKRMVNDDHFEIINESGDLLIIRDYKYTDHNG